MTSDSCFFCRTLYLLRLLIELLFCSRPGDKIREDEAPVVLFIVIGVELSVLYSSIPKILLYGPETSLMFDLTGVLGDRGML